MIAHSPIPLDDNSKQTLIIALSSTLLLSILLGAVVTYVFYKAVTKKREP